MSKISAEQAESVEACTRAFLERFLGGQDTYRELATKQLVFFDKLGDGAGETAGEELRQLTQGVERVKARRVDGQVAEVEVDAWVRYVADLPDRGPAELSSSIKGPAILHNTSEGWRVADFVMDGLPFVRSGFTASGETLDLVGLTLSPVALRRRAESTLLFLDVRNRSDGEAAIVEMTTRQRLLGFIPWQPYGAFLPGATFEAGTQGVFGAVFHPRLPVKRRMKLKVSARSPYGSESGVMEFEVEQARLDDPWLHGSRT